jgi:hypothetical protein
MLAFPEVSVTTVTILDMVTLRYGQIKARRLRWASPSRPHMPGYGLPEGPDGLMPWIWAEQRHCGQGTTDRSPGRYRSENEDNANNRIFQDGQDE